VLVVLNGHLAVTKVLISIERFLAFYNYYENKNYFLTYLIAIVSIFIVSCGGSNDSPESVSPTTPEDNLPDSSKKFVGYWHNSSTLLSSCDFAFYPNGKCSRFSTSEENHQDDGYWTFNEKTNILSTTTGGWQWEITLSNTDSWAGVTLGSSNKAQSYTRDNLRFVRASINNTSWKYNDLSMRFGSNFYCDEYPPLEELYKPSAPQNKILNLSRYIALSNPQIYDDYMTAEYEVKDSYREDKYTIGGTKYGFITPSRSIDKGTITIKRPWADDGTIILSNHPDHEYKKVVK